MNCGLPDCGLAAFERTPITQWLIFCSPARTTVHVAVGTTPSLRTGAPDWAATSVAATVAAMAARATSAARIMVNSPLIRIRRTTAPPGSGRRYRRYNFQEERPIRPSELSQKTQKPALMAPLIDLVPGAA